MSGRPTIELSALPDNEGAALLFALDPHGFGGIVVRGGAGPEREAWLRRLRTRLPPDRPWRRLPANAEHSLDDSLDLTATLATGRPVTCRGLLAQGDGGIMLVPMAERLSDSVAGRLCAALDTGRAPGGAAARFGIVALDDGLDDETVPATLRDRLAFAIEFAAGDLTGPFQAVEAGTAEAAARIEVGQEIARSLAATAAAIGIESMRPPLLALRATRAAAALAGRTVATDRDAAAAARLVLAPRATVVPATSDTQEAGGNRAAESRQSEPAQEAGGQSVQTSDEVVLAAVRSALPPGVLLGLEADGRAPRQKSGGAGAKQAAPTRGRPSGVRRGHPRGGARLNLVETLRAAAPWQALRRTALPESAAGARRVQVRGDDLRLTRFQQRSETVTLFVVDASGSLALQRLAEAKGAVELLLAECYVRRDQVALLAFRGTGAQLLLPPTRSLARAKRCLADLAGGGATPLPAALDAVLVLADGVRRRGRTPVVVLFTDGRANVARDGAVDRMRAEADTRAAARAVAEARLRTLLIDAAPRPQPRARDLAAAMSATYLPLPRSDAAALTSAIRRGLTD